MQLQTLLDGDLISENLLSTFVPLTAESESITVHGTISTEPAPSKDLQFISINGRPDDIEADGRALHNAVDVAFENSSFGIAQKARPTSNRDRRKHNETTSAPAYDKRWPVYILRVIHHGYCRDYGVIDGNDHSVETTADVLTSLVGSFLEKHHYAPVRGFDQVATPGWLVTKTAESEIASAFALDGIAKDVLSSKLYEPAKRPSSSIGLADLTPEWTRAKHGAVERTRPMTAQTPGSGAFRSPASPSSLKGLCRSNASASPLGPAQCVDLQPETQCKTREQVDVRSSAALNWCASFLQSWENPKFKFVDSSLAGQSGRHSGQSRINSTLTVDGPMTMQRSTKMSKDALKSAQVIGQVDKKFILIKVADGHSSMLVLVDQHAASERCVLEDLFNRFCQDISGQSAGNDAAADDDGKVCAGSLAKPVNLKVRHDEARLLLIDAAHFASWGIQYEIQKTGISISASSVAHDLHSEVVVTSLPQVCAQRCVQDPALLLNLLRSEVWSRNAAGKIGHSQIQDASMTKAWPVRMRGCPQGLVDMINSRACRSAIMFNDALTFEECQELMEALARCNFPFICAHGRTNMVPLCTLDAGN